MRRFWVASLSVGLALALGGSLRAEGKADAQAIIDKAIKAAGGETNLAKFKAMTWKDKGTFHGLGMPLPYTGVMAVQWPDQSREAIDSEAMGQKFIMVMVVNRDKGWLKINDMLMELDKDKLAEQKEDLHASYVSTLLPLKDKAYTLTALGASKLGDQAVLGVKVSSKGHRNVQLYFDKETGLLAKSANIVKEEGKEINQEAFYSAYKEVAGVKQPIKIKINRDGKLYVEAENSDIKPADKLDDTVFAKP